LSARKIPGLLDLPDNPARLLNPFFTPCVEIGWRLDQEFWGHGYATEAAIKALNRGFSEYGLKDIVSLTAMNNFPSRRVMERLGMKHDANDDFNHPELAPGHTLRRHVLYRITQKGL